MKLSIRPMTRRDLRAVLRIEQASYPRPWTQGMFTGELDPAAGRTYLVATSGGRLVGYGGLLYVLPDAHVTTIAVDPSFRRGRVASVLLLHLVRDAIGRGATALTLEVRVSNDAAQALYRRFGFAPAGARKGYYPPDDDLPAEDALVMWAHDIDRPPFAERLAAIEAELHPLEASA
jgi:ribosomal-protein-alanine N-acetyltransferase